MTTFRILRLASLYQLAGLAALLVVVAFTWPRGAGGVLLGGLLMALNFWLLRFLLTKAFGGSQPKVAYALALGFKLVLVLGLMALLVLVLHVDALGLAAGLATLFVGIMGATAHQSFQPATDCPARE